MLPLDWFWGNNSLFKRSLKQAYKNNYFFKKSWTKQIKCFRPWWPGYLSI